MYVKKLLKTIDQISEWTGRIFSTIVAVLMLLVVLEVVLRRFLNSPTVWSFEVTLQLYAFHFLIAAAYALLHGSHVAVDILYARLSRRKRAILDVATYIIFFFPFLAILLFEGIKYASVAWSIRERTLSVFGAPLYPIKSVVPVMAFLLIIQGLAIFIRQLHVAIWGEEL